MNLLPFANFLQGSAIAAGANTLFLESGTDATRDFSFYDQNSGCVSSTTVANTGPRSIKCDNGSWFKKMNVLDDAGRRISFYLYMNSFPSADDAIVGIDTSSNGYIYEPVGIQASSHKLFDPDNPGFVGTTVLQTGQWYHIALSYTITDATHNQWTVFLNGNQEYSKSNAGLIRAGSNEIFLGRLFGTSGAALFYFDDIYIDDGNTLDDPGAINVANKRPNANGANNQFTSQIGLGGSGYGTGHAPQVNEQPLNTANGWQTVSASQSENYAIENASTGDVDISTATLIADEAWIYGSSGASCTGNITNNGTSTGTISLTTTNTLFTNIVSNSSYPSNSAAVGIVSCASATTVSLYETGMLIAYTSGGSGVPEGALLLLPIIPFVPKLVHVLITKWHKRRQV